PPISTLVLLAMSRLGDRNDWWDWGVILLLVAGGTFLLWVSVWLVRSELATPRGSASALDAPLVNRQPPGGRAPPLGAGPKAGLMLGVPRAPAPAARLILPPITAALRPSHRLVCSVATCAPAIVLGQASASRSTGGTSLRNRQTWQGE